MFLRISPLSRKDGHEAYKHHCLKPGIQIRDFPRGAIRAGGHQSPPMLEGTLARKRSPAPGGVNHRPIIWYLVFIVAPITRI